MIFVSFYFYYLKKEADIICLNKYDVSCIIFKKGR